MIDKIAQFCTNLSQSLASIVKTAIMSRRPFKSEITDSRREIVILGNGPSLNTTVSLHRYFLSDKDRMAVNFAANTPLFADLKPQFYILADPHFFNSDSCDNNVSALWENILKTDWKMTVFIPTKFCKNSRVNSLKSNKSLTVRFFNLTPTEGFRRLCWWFYDSGIGSPRPRNVLIPALMTAIRSGYGKIYIAGADHSWSKTLEVDDENRVISVQPHFYTDNEEERQRVSVEYQNYPLHHILKSLYIAFRAYFDIEDYARHKNVDIFNITPGSFIDAFRRMKL